MPKTKIEWAKNSDGSGGATWNPIRARNRDTGRVGTWCQTWSPGCQHCYAAAHNHRNLPHGSSGLPYTAKGGEKAEIFIDPKILAEPLRRRKPETYFVCSMTDLFQAAHGMELIAAVWGVMAACPQHTFQVLTKRPERAREFLGAYTFVEEVERFHQIAAAGRIAEFYAPERHFPVVGWPGYFVSSRGVVTSTKRLGRERELSPDIGEKGHARVMLYRDGRSERVGVHRLVLEAFDRPAKPGEQGCHLDGNAENNALWNLRWGTQEDNWQDRLRHGNGRSYAKLSQDQALEIRARCGRGDPAERVGPEYGISGTQARNIATGRQWVESARMRWPLPGVWLGTSVENQEYADRRISELLAAPAAVRFLSIEPLLGPVNLTRLDILPRLRSQLHAFAEAQGRSDNEATANYIGPAWQDALSGRWFDGEDAGTRSERVDWVIVGGESGPRRREMDVAWAQSIRDQCGAAGVAFFMKQDSGPRAGMQGRLPDDLWNAKEMPR